MDDDVDQAFIEQTRQLTRSPTSLINQSLAKEKAKLTWRSAPLHQPPIEGGMMDSVAKLSTIITSLGDVKEEDLQRVTK